MSDAVADLMLGAVAFVMCAALVWAWWWETHGRRGWERDLRRREDADHRERRKRGTKKGGRG